MKKITKLLAAVMCCLCLVVTAQPTFAAVPAPAGTVSIAPFWTTLNTVALSMSYSSGKVNWGGIISCNSSVTSISVVYTLEKQSSGGGYTFVQSWTRSGTNTYLDSSDSATSAKGTYRLTAAVTTKTSSGATENTSVNLIKTFS